MIVDIEYGPFNTEYHLSLVNDTYRENFVNFIENILTPQLDEMPSRITGTVRAEFDEEKYCGPNSAVRDIFNIKLAIASASGISDYKAKLKYINPSFEVTRGSTLYLWTPGRKAQREKELELIENIVLQVKNSGKVTEVCPVCGDRISFVNNDYILDIRCDQHCFNHNYDKDPETGEILHGHIHISDPKYN